MHSTKHAQCMIKNIIYNQPVQIDRESRACTVAILKIRDSKKNMAHTDIKKCFYMFLYASYIICRRGFSFIYATRNHEPNGDTFDGCHSYQYLNGPNVFN